MAELLAQKKREGERLDSIAMARQEMFECRKGVEASVAGGNPLATHFMMAHLKERIDKVNLRFLTEISDKEYHNQTAAMWATKYAQLLPGWSDDARASASQLFSLLPATCEHIHHLQTLTQRANGPTLTETSLAP